MEPVTYLVLLLILTVALLLGYLIVEKRKREDLEAKLLRAMFDHEKVYFKQELLSQNESRFYADLQKTFASNYHILPLVSLSALLNVKEDRHLLEKHPHLGKFYFDFVLCSKTNFKPICVVELNDKIRNAYQKKQRDAYFMSVLQSINIKYFSCESNYLTYDHYMEDLKKLLQ